MWLCCCCWRIFSGESSLLEKMRDPGRGFGGEGPRGVVDVISSLMCERNGELSPSPSLLRFSLLGAGFWASYVSWRRFADGVE
jgi:hypothetical protein